MASLASLGNFARVLGLNNMRPVALATQFLNFFLVLSSAFMLWKGLSVAADSKSPIVVVLSGSMEPAFQRGDLLFLWNRNLGWAGYNGDSEIPQTQVGEIVVYEVRGKDIPIVHRVIRTFGGNSGSSVEGGDDDDGGKRLQLLTKGDNNAADDTALYARGQKFLDRQRDVVGSVVGYVPYVGYGTILLSEYPWLKSLMLVLMGVTVVLQRE